MKVFFAFLLFVSVVHKIQAKNIPNQPKSLYSLFDVEEPDCGSIECDDDNDCFVGGKGCICYAAFNRCYRLT